jgi:hypothetical protein
MGTSLLSVCLLCDLLGTAVAYILGPAAAECGFVHHSSPARAVKQQPWQGLCRRKTSCCSSSSTREFLRVLARGSDANHHRRAGVCSMKGVVEGDSVNDYFSGEVFTTRMSSSASDSSSSSESLRETQGQAQGQATTKVLEDSDFYDRDWKTPLWMVSQEPDLNNLVKYLQMKKGICIKMHDFFLKNTALSHPNVCLRLW